MKLKESKIYDVFGNDIPYQDGVIEVLRGNSDIDILILNESLVGEYEIKDFLNMICKINQYIEIIFFMEKENISLKNFLRKLGISKIFIDNTDSIDDIIKSIGYEKDTEANLSLEIEKLKKIIQENQQITKNKNIKEVKKMKKIRTNKIVAISGNYGSGKSLITTLLGVATRKFDIKTIIVDFDIINSSINMLFRVPKYNSNYKIITDPIQCINKIDNKLDVFCGIDMLFNEENKISYEKVNDLFEKLKSEYDLILVDTSSETTLKYIKTILLNVDKIIFLVEPTLLEIKKSEKLLETYIEDWEIPINKFEIILNKVNSGSIDENILKNIFEKVKIIGKLNFSSQYTACANDIKNGGFILNKYINRTNS